ncbi:hypothetical protein [Microbacterium thalassium]|uniref:Uncharacterized protein n=1 Tax=Microbacterium thalassium TaxID=362649 RepID=A0A7X0KTE4_9MICO|nr:hypothetical protein [Microbacterium thalassium]MBB6390002.1 hypothetical protein [Microbacterium thalassium]GLK24688.1 hypothetical protein GCM10017607_20060 [Microbacterium thalassium]
MIDRSTAEAVTYRTAVTAFTYYPTKLLDEPGYNVDEDIDWCLEPLDADLRPAFRTIARDVITDPNADRQAYIRHLMNLVP